MTTSHETSPQPGPVALSSPTATAEAAAPAVSGPLPPVDPAIEKAEKERREVMDWAEARGLEYLKEHMANVDTLKADSSTLLTILVAAGGATLAYVIKAPETHASAAMVGGAVFLLVYLFALGAILITKCLTAKEASSVHNSAKSLYQKGSLPLAVLKPLEFDNMEERQKKLLTRNSTTALWLNRVRYAALCCPIIFVLGCLVMAFTNVPHLFDSLVAIWSQRP